MTDLELAIKNGYTCKDCKHIQFNKKVKERIMDWHCYHPDLIQSGYYGKCALRVNKDFLCNKFEMDKNDSD